MLKPYLQLLFNKASLTTQESEAAINLILDGADPHQTAAFFAILKFRGETADEVIGMVNALKAKALPASLPFPVLDIVGTGGDLAHTVNISTGSAILAAACGIPIAKHGNRSVSSRSGAADVLEALGVNIETSSSHLLTCLQEAQIAFMYAPLYHPSLKKIAPIRKGLSLPTVMNILGPLLNPANAEYALIGVPSEAILELMSQVVVKQNHRKRTLVFFGAGLDELTPLGKVLAYDIHHGQRHFLEIDPTTLGFSRCSLKELQGGDAQLNAKLLKEVFAGKSGALADALIFNAAAALLIFGKSATLTEGIQIARTTLHEGKALAVLNKLIHVSKKGTHYEV